MTKRKADAYVQGLRLAALHAIECQAYNSAADLLSLGLYYRFPQVFPGGLPAEARPLWRAKLKLDGCLRIIDCPQDWTDPDTLWAKKLNEAIELLKGVPDADDLD